ncbi:MAG: SpoIID/LytB domain-containing protein, partial [Gammaproteobacteria bacterium]
VRVGVAVDTTAVTVSAQTEFDILAGDRVLATSPAGEAWTVRSATDGRLEATSATGASIAPQDGPLRVVPRMVGTVLISGRAYRGQTLLLSRGGGRVTAVNVVDLEAYLLGVVPREIGRRPPNEIEAVKAQAVAARTYAVGNMGGREQLGFDFYATIMDQVYGGVADEDSVVTRAVSETRGEIITYDGRPILAYYSSTCGGQTAAIEDSWPWRAPLPYLKSVPDVAPGTDRAYCSTSSRFRWTATWTRDQLLAVLGQTLRTFASSAGQRVRAVQDVEAVATNESGRTTVRLVADDQVYNLRADSVRWVLRPQPGPAILNSSKLYEVRTTDDTGQVTGLEITGGGWGHGIGMCQVGAMGRARAGQTYHQILTAYYTGTEIRRLY